MTTPSQSSNKTGGDAIKRSAPVGRLARIRDQLHNKLAAKRDAAEELAERRLAESKFKPGIYREDGGTFLVLPNSVFEEDNMVGAMIVDLAKAFAIEIRVLEASTEKINPYDEKYIIGVWFGMTCGFLNRKRARPDQIELGRTESFYLRVREYFRLHPSLGEQALVRDNFFFGNDPNEKINGSAVHFDLKVRIESLYPQEVSQVIYGFLVLCAQLEGLSALDDADLEKTIMGSIEPIDTLIRSNYRPLITASRAGRKVVKGERRPNLPRQSPLLMPEEMNLINRIIAPLFSDLETLSKGYLSQVRIRGFSDVKRQITDSINSRFQTLERFAKVTKIRLQAARKVANNPLMRKAGVLQEHTVALLAMRTDLLGSLADEILHILPAADRLRVLSEALKMRFSNLEEARNALLLQAYTCYANMDKLVKRPTVKPDIDLTKLPRFDLSDSIKGVARVEQLLGNFKLTLNGLQRKKDAQFVGVISQIMNQQKELDDALKRITEFNVELTLAAVSHIRGGGYLSMSEYYSSIRTQIEKFWSILLSAIQIRSNTTDQSGVRATLESALKEIDRKVKSLLSFLSKA